MEVRPFFIDDDDDHDDDGPPNMKVINPEIFQTPRNLVPLNFKHTHRVVDEGGGVRGGFMYGFKAWYTTFCV